MLHRLAFTDLILARGDTFAYFYPYWEARNAALLAGYLPLWSPDLFMGVPLLANSQLGTFYPPNWLVAPLSAPDGVRVSILLHVLWAALGAYRLARTTLSVGRPAALIGAALFALGGYVGAHVEQINQLQGLAWMPWLFWLLARASERPARYTLWLALALALQFFTGHTQTVFITGLGLAVYALLTRPLRGLLTLAAAAALAVALASPQLIPTLELTRVSNRSGGMTPNQATAFSFSPFVAGRGLLPSYDTQIFGEYIAYLGVIGLGLAAIGALSPSPHPLSHVNGERGFLHRVFSSLRRERGDRKHPKGAGVRSLRPPQVWLVVALVGLALAFGLYNPLYWPLASLPGFNLFRVPARWLALFALGAAMLATLGAQGWMDGQRIRPRALFAAVGLIALLGISTALTERNPDGTPSPLPTLTTILGWGAALAAFALLMLNPTPRHPPRIQGGAGKRASSLEVPLRANGVRGKQARLLGEGFRVKASRVLALNLRPYLLVGLVALELFAASRVQPYNDLSAPEAYSAQRFTISQMRAYNAAQTPPGRFLSISNLLFDPGDRAALDARYRALGLSESAIRHAFVATKMKETLAANLPLTWNIPTIDGFDGGLLPTAYYSAFTSLLLPAGEARTVDGRLREILAQAACRGACIPDQRWLNLTNIRYLITDKVYDVVANGIFYDTQFTTTLAAGESARFDNPTGFEADSIRILCGGCRPQVTFHYSDGTAEALIPNAADDSFAALSAESARVPAWIEISGDDVQFVAATLLDTRTGDFQQLTPSPWARALSSDIKIYENAAVLPRALVVYDSFVTPDSNTGTEAALDIMRAPDFDPAQVVVLSALTLNLSPSGGGASEATPVLPPLPEGEGSGVRADSPLAEGEVSEVRAAPGVRVSGYTPERVVIHAEAERAGYLLLTDAYYPGWTATVNGQPTPIHRADVMFRAVPIPAGESEVIFEYRPAWLPGALIFGGAAWVITLLAALSITGNKKFTH